MVVEDETQVVALLQRCLSRRGHEVVVCNDAETAEARMAAEDLDVLVTDVTLPGRTGVELVERLRSAGSRVPVILMSGYPEPLANDAGVLDDCVFLPKPFSVATLVEMIETHWN
jgi:DNA-binding NtrC family response regulator